MYGNLYTLQITALWLGGEQDRRRRKLPGFVSLLLFSNYGFRHEIYSSMWLVLYIFFQFRSLSDQLYRSSEHHNFVREQVVNQVERYIVSRNESSSLHISLHFTFSHILFQLAYNREMYEGYVPMAYTDYLKTMKRSETLSLLNQFFPLIY